MYMKRILKLALDEIKRLEDQIDEMFVDMNQLRDSAIDIEEQLHQERAIKSSERMPIVNDNIEMTRRIDNLIQERDTALSLAQTYSTQLQRVTVNGQVTSDE